MNGARSSSILVALIVSAVMITGCADSEEPLAIDAEAEESAELRQSQETEVEEVEPAVREDVSPSEYFHSPELDSLIRNGSFEQFAPGDKYPAGWGDLLVAPVCEPEAENVRFGNRSIKLTGAEEEQARLRPTPYPPREELNGNTITWGAWMYTDQPAEVSLQIIEGWDRYNTVRPSAENEWELVTVTQEVTEDMGTLHFAITINPQVECYVDQAAIVIGALNDDEDDGA